MSRNVILRNTLFSYGRTFLAVFLALFSSRWVLADLGAADYGLYGLVGGLMVIINFIQNTIGQGSDRYLAYSIGEGDKETVNDWFNTAANLFMVMPVILLPLGWLIGEVIVRHCLDIQPGRLGAALWVLRFSLVSVAVTLIASAYRSMLLAKQHIHFVTVVSLLRNVGMFVIALVLPCFSGDHLILYSGFVTLTVLLMNILYIIVCRVTCEEAYVRFSKWWEWRRLRSFFSFSGWITLGSVGTVIRQTGIGILLNWMRGTSANAGLGVASQLSGEMQTLAQSFLVAVSPEVARRAGARQLMQMISLTKRSVKLGMLLLLLVGLPLFCECDSVLKLWLGNPPPYAAFFTRIVILEVLMSKLVFGHRMCFNAIGKVAGRNIIEVSTLSLVVVVVAVIYYLSRSVELAFCGCVLVKLLYVALNVWWGERCFSWKQCEYYRDLFLPVVMSFTIGLIAYFGVVGGFGAGSLIRVLLTTLACDIYLVAFFAGIVFNQMDRQDLANRVRTFANKFPLKSFYV